MKKWKLIACVCIPVLIYTLITCIIFAATPTEMNYYSYADKLSLMEIYDTQDLTADTLESRNGKLIIERVIGVVEDAESGAGRCFNGEEYYNYINYKRVKGIKNGDIICTYMIYNPDNNYVDDIMMRFDYIIDTEQHCSCP